MKENGLDYELTGDGYAIDISGTGSPRTAGFGFDRKLSVWKTPFPSCIAKKSGAKPLGNADKESLDKLRAHRKDRYEASFASEGFWIDDPVMRPYQKAGLEYILIGDNILLADEMGLGKTLQAIGYLNYINKKPYKALVICPASLKSNWLKECQKFLHVIPAITIVDPKDKIEEPEPGIYIVNYDIVGRFNSLINHKWDVLILDEAHYVKNQKSKRTATILGGPVGGGIKADKIIAISGTPIENKPFEFFTLLKALEPFGFSNRMVYERRYCGGRQGRFGWDNNGARHLGELERKIRSTVMIRRLKRDVAKDIPEKTRKLVYLDLSLSKEQKKLEKLSLKELLGSLRPGSANGVQIMKARKELGEMKVKAALTFIKDMLEEVDKLLIFCVHKNVVKGLTEGLANFKPLVVDGSTPVKKRQGIVDSFQEDKKRRVFIGNVTAAGVGITLTAASNVVFVEYSFKPGENKQAEDRAHRIGQKNSVMAHYLVVNNSLDSKVLLSLIEKEKVLNTLLGGFDDNEE